MYVITINEKEVGGIGEVLDYMEENGYPRLVNENVAFIPDAVTIYENVEVSEEIKNNWFKYCYTPEQGFYENPNYVEPDSTNIYNIPDEIYYAIKEQTITEVLGGIENGID